MSPLILRLFKTKMGCERKAI